MAEAATEIAKKIEEKSETTVTLTPSETVEATSKPVCENKKAEEEVKEKETSSLVEKLKIEVEIEASAEKFHHMFATKPHHVSKATPGNIQSCDLHEGEWGQVGSIIFWNYVHDGVAKVLKERIEELEPEKNLITFRVLEGDLLKEYKSFLIRIQVTPKLGEPGSIVHWHVEYEKISDEVAHPETLLQFFVEISKEIDEHLLSEE
ncbi:MLP-like protein 28 [Cardamine amara subsp. amara]|uniref:MLP-like protein 28 n=1 Tax=Cardamine amara subsp. amara TaxID=228776 RepID=A0ABD1BEM6_CARAN